MTGASLPTATAPSTTWNSAHRARLSLSVARRHVEIKMARSPEAASSARSRLRLPLASGQPRPISRLGRADQPYRACLRHRQDDHGHVDAFTLTLTLILSLTRQDDHGHVGARGGGRPT